MSLTIGIGGFSAAYKSGMANLFCDELQKAGLKAAWPCKYVTRPKRSNDDPNTLYAESEFAIPAGWIKGNVNGQVFAYDLAEIKNMLADDVWPILQTSSLDFLFELKNKLLQQNPMLEQLSGYEKGMFASDKLEQMRVFYCHAPFQQESELRKLTRQRGVGADEINEEVSKKLLERDFCRAQHMKYFLYVSRSSHACITRLGNVDGTLDAPIDALRRIVSEFVKSSNAIDKVNKFFTGDVRQADNKYLLARNTFALNDIMEDEKVEITKDVTKGSEKSGYV